MTGQIELALSTDYNNEPLTVEGIENCLRNIREAGFTHVHWCNEWDSDYLYARSEMLQIKEWMDSFGLRCKAIHATTGRVRCVNRVKEHYRKDYTSSIEYNRIAGVELIKNRVDMAEVLGTNEIVLHMYLPYLDFEKDPGAKERFYEIIYRSFDELMPYCLQKQVKICIENLFDAPGDLQLERFDRIFEKYPAEFLGLCLDTGHANLMWGSTFAQVLAKRYADRIFAVHIHDNNGWGGLDGCGDAHRIPFTCGIDFGPFMKVLKNSVYELPILMELVQKQDEEEKSFLKDAYQAGIRLMGLYEEA